MKKSILISLAAIILAIVLVVRIVTSEQKFSTEVQKSHSVSAGYDREFIGLVNRLERELALRAQFGFKGKKDPLTSRRRVIAEPAEVAPVQVASIAVRSSSRSAKVIPQPVGTAKSPTPTVRVTAIIFDDSKNKYTAMVMEGDRSQVLEVGDAYGYRKVTAISSSSVTISDVQNSYTYDLRGQVTVHPQGQPQIEGEKK